MTRRVAIVIAAFALITNANCEDKSVSPLEELSSLRVPIELSSADVGEARIEARHKDKSSAFAAVALLLSAGDQDDYLELLWWRSEHANVRALIVAAFKCRTLENREGVPAFEAFAKRFQAQEADQRLTETQLVQTNLLHFARALKQITYGVQRCESLHRQYESVVRSLESRK